MPEPRSERTHADAAASAPERHDLDLELEILQLRQKLNLEWASQWEHLLGVQRQQMCLLESIFEGTPRWSREAGAAALARPRNARERALPESRPAFAPAAG